MKKIVTVLMAVLLASCGKTPEDVLLGLSESHYRVAKVLQSNASDDEKLDALQEEKDTVKELKSDARKVKGSPLDYFLADAKMENSKTHHVAKGLRGCVASKDMNQKVRREYSSYMLLSAETKHELKASCDISSSRYDDDDE